MSHVPRVAFQGELGAFSEEAARAYFDGTARTLPCRTFQQVGDAIAAGRAEYGVLPVENTLAGGVGAAYDVLAATNLIVIGEVIRRIHHCLLGPPGASTDGVRRAISHPVALAQCMRFFSERVGIETVATYDTGGAAKEVSQRGDPTLAAVAGHSAAERYGLRVLADGIQDRSDNQTRFLVVARPGTAAPARHGSARPRKAALIIETKNRPGALVEVLTPFASRDINLCKLESRPADTPWRYRFFVELDADAAPEQTAGALQEVRDRAVSLRVLGSFPSGRSCETA